MSKNVVPEDISKIVLISNPLLSPLGDKLLFLASKADLDNDRYRSRVWIADVQEGKAEALTEGPSDTCPKWRPDGKAFSFLSRRTLKDDEPGQEFWVWRPGESEPHMVRVFKGGVNYYEWAPNSRDVLIITTSGKPDEDVKVIESIPIWFNGRGFTYWGWSALKILDTQSEEVVDVMPEKLDITAATWSPDGRRIAYLSTPDKLKPYLQELHVVDIESSEDVKVSDGLTAYDLSWSPDGERIAVLGHRRKRGLLSHNRILIFNIQAREEIDATGFLDRNVGNSMNSDVRGPSCNHAIKWVKDRIFFLLDNEGRVELHSINPLKDNMEGTHEVVLKGDGTIDEFDITYSGDLITYTFMDWKHPKEIYVMKDGSSKKLTHFNDPLIKNLRLVEPEHFRFKASDGATLDGWVMMPPDGGGTGLPWILYIHGGPTTQFGWSFIHEFHVLNGKGFAVIFTNPRGSTGYSEEFADIRGHYGERDYKDLMEFVDEVMRRYPQLDPEKGGVTGGSYGGFMTNWIITHTSRFKAAVTQRSISDWISMYGTTDIGFYFVEDQIGCIPWKNVDDCLRQSPLAYVENAKTPLLIIHSMEDYRCWLDQALQLFTALKVRGVESRLALFPKENHNLSRSGKPKHRVKRLELISEWFEKHLTDKKDEEKT